MASTPTPEFTPVPSDRRLMVEQIDVGMYMSTRECDRIKERVKAIRDPLQWPKTLAWTAGALGIGALLSLWQWNGTYDLLPIDQQLQKAWIGTALLAVVIGSVVVIITSVLFHRANRDEIVRDKQSVLDLLDAIEERYRATET